MKMKTLLKAASVALPLILSSGCGPEESAHTSKKIEVRNCPKDCHVLIRNGRWNQANVLKCQENSLLDENGDPTVSGVIGQGHVGDNQVKMVCGVESPTEDDFRNKGKDLAPVNTLKPCITQPESYCKTNAVVDVNAEFTGSVINKDDVATFAINSFQKENGIALEGCEAKVYLMQKNAEGKFVAVEEVIGSCTTDKFGLCSVVVTSPEGKTYEIRVKLTGKDADKRDSTTGSGYTIKKKQTKTVNAELPLKK